MQFKGHLISIQYIINVDIIPNGLNFSLNI